MTLQHSLEKSFRESLELGQPQILKQCLRTYATIDKMKDAEALFQQVVVKPFMEEVRNFIGRFKLVTKVMIRPKHNTRKLEGDRGAECMFTAALDCPHLHLECGEGERTVGSNNRL